MAEEPEPTTPTPTVNPTLIIERTPYPKWWKDARAWGVDLTGPGTRVVIAPTPGYRTYISSIVLTVDGETNVTIGMGVFGVSGAMDFGGEGQPKGIVMAMGNSPLPCGEGGLTISSDGAGVHLTGLVVYYYEQA